jgi:cell division protein FtsL
MLKMLLCILCAFLIGICLLQLRQQELELRHQTADLQMRIQAKQARLWNQQLEIAVYTAPNAMTQTIAQQGLKLSPAAKLPEEAGDWAGMNRKAVQAPVAQAGR